MANSPLFSRHATYPVPRARRRIGAAGWLLLAAALGSCATQDSVQTAGVGEAGNAAWVRSDPDQAKFVPRDGRILLILGQDLDAVYNYRRSGLFPVPGGVTTYLAFYNLLGPAHPAYGGLGEDRNGEALIYDTDWGAGRLNAHTAAHGFKDSALVIGLNLAEGNGRATWADGELSRVGLGQHDDKIRRLARFCRSVGSPVYLRVGYEFDGAWNSGYENQGAYIDAFRRIVDVMRREGVDNVAYVWQASASPVDDVIDGRQENLSDWYPGDAYVDWIGLSWFLNPDARPRPVASQRELADEVLALARQRGKPVMIAESAPQGYDLSHLTRSAIGELWDGPPGQATQQLNADQLWSEWFAPFFDYIAANADAVRAVAYINTHWNAQSLWSAPYRNGYWGDSRLQGNPEISQRWLQQIKNTSIWLHGGPELEQQLAP